MTSLIRGNLPVLLVIAPLFVAFVLPVMSRRARLVDGLVISVGLLGAAGTAYLTFIFLKISGLTISYSLGGWDPPWGIQIAADNLSVFFLLVISLIGIPVSLFSFKNLRDEVGDDKYTVRFQVLYLLLMGALAGMAVTRDLFNVFVLVEVATLSCCGLVSAHREPKAAYAAFTYLLLATLGSTFVLGGIGFIYIITGHLNMGFASQELFKVWQSSPHVVWMAFSFLLVGFGVKSALFPLHLWLPDAHSSAPAPASAILSGLAVKGYIICLLKILFNVFGHTIMESFALNKIFIVAGAMAIIAGSVLALKQDELKTRLAFSTVAQVGYIFLGFGLVNPEGLTGALFYLASHGVSKAVLFLAAGAMISISGKKNISQLAGIGKKMPITMGAFTVGSLSLVGIPMFSGFLGKWHLLTGSINGGNPLAVAVIIIGSILCAAYLFPVLRIAYFEQASGEDWHDPGVAQRIALLILVVAIIGLGIFPGPFMEFARRAAVDLLALH